MTYGQLASASADGTVRLWDTATGQLTATLEAHTGPVRAVAFSPNGQLASASADGTVRLWDPASGRPTHTPEDHTDGVTAVAFSPPGRQPARQRQRQRHGAALGHRQRPAHRHA